MAPAHFEGYRTIPPYCIHEKEALYYQYGSSCLFRSDPCLLTFLSHFFCLPLVHLFVLIFSKIRLQSLFLCVVIWIRIHSIHSNSSSMSTPFFSLSLPQLRPCSLFFSHTFVLRKNRRWNSFWDFPFFTRKPNVCPGANTGVEQKERSASERRSKIGMRYCC